MGDEKMCNFHEDENSYKQELRFLQGKYKGLLTELEQTASHYFSTESEKMTEEFGQQLTIEAGRQCERNLNRQIEKQRFTLDEIVNHISSINEALKVNQNYDYAFDTTTDMIIKACALLKEKHKLLKSGNLPTAYRKDLINLDTKLQDAKAELDASEEELKKLQLNLSDHARLTRAVYDALVPTGAEEQLDIVGDLKENLYFVSASYVDRCTLMTSWGGPNANRDHLKMLLRRTSFDHSLYEAVQVYENETERNDLLTVINQSGLYNFLKNRALELGNA